MARDPVFWSEATFSVTTAFDLQLQISFEEKDSKYFHTDQEVNHKLFAKIPKLICTNNFYQFTKILKYKKIM